MSTGDYWFTHVYKSQAAERIRAGEQERLAAEVRSAYRGPAACSAPPAPWAGASS